MAKKKKNFFKLIFKGIFFIFKLVFKLSKNFYLWIKKKIEKEKKIKKIKSSPYYNVSSKLIDFELRNKILGNFKSFNKQLLKKSLIIVVFGKRGSGKSALGFRILENINSKSKRKCYVLGVEQELLPKWIKSIDNIESVSDGGVILVDEGAVDFGSRTSMSAKNKELTKLMAIARHKDLTLLFVTQNTGMIDKNILKLVDSLFIKEGSLLQTEMERSEIKKFYSKSKKMFNKIKGDRRKYSYIIDADFEGFISYKLPGFWREEVSKSQKKN